MTDRKKMDERDILKEYSTKLLTEHFGSEFVGEDFGCLGCYKYLDKALSSLRSHYKEKLLERINEQSNPYPEEVFTPMTKADWVKVNEVLKKELGYPLDRLSGNIGRELYKNILSQLKQIIDDTFATPKGGENG